MAGKSDTFENDLLKLIFHGTAITGLAENHSVPYGNLFVSLHSTTLADTASATTNELSYTNYARATLSRTSTAWTVNGSSVTPAANITFPTNGDVSTVSVVAVSITDTVSGNGKILYYGSLSPSFTIINAEQPIIASTSVITED